MALDVEPVHETKGLERFLVELSGEVASSLVAKVGHSFLHELPIVGVVLVHGCVDPVRRKKKKKPPPGFPDGGFLVFGDGWVRLVSARTHPPQKVPSGNSAYRDNNTRTARSEPSVSRHARLPMRGKSPPAESGCQPVHHMDRSRMPGSVVRILHPVARLRYRGAVGDSPREGGLCSRPRHRWSCGR